MIKLYRFFAIIVVLVFFSSLNAKGTVTERYGDYIQISLPIIAYSTILLLDDKDGENEFYKSFFSTFAATHILKHTVKEERPNGTNTKSFPSGHTSVSFQSATYIHVRYGFKYAIPAYLGASYVGYSRVYGNKHYVHDVLAGAIIGSGFSYYFSTPYKYKSTYIEPIVYNSMDYKNTVYGVKVTW